MSTSHGHLQTEQSPFLPSGTYYITNVRHGVSLSIPDRQDEVCGSLKRNFMWKIFNDSDRKWYIQGGAGPWFAHRRPSPRAGNTIIASQEQFGWVIGQCHAIRNPNCYIIYAISDHTLLWGLQDGEDETPVTLCTGETNRKNWWRFQRIPDDDEDQLGSPVDADLPRYVAVMGTTGSGTSSFINDATGWKLDIRGDLDSCTSRVYATQILLDGRPVVLLDTPCFGDKSLSDAEVLGLTAEYLADLYRKEIKLSGLLYMQRISIPRADSQTLHYFRMFQKLCGHANLDHIQVVTTHWNDVESRVGCAREKEFMNGVFKPVLEAGGRIVRHDQTVHSAKAILRHVLEKDAIVLKIQSQLVDHDIELHATDAGLEIPRSVEVGKPRGFRRWLKMLWLKKWWGRQWWGSAALKPSRSVDAVPEPLVLGEVGAMLRCLDDSSGAECVRMASSAKIYQRLIAYVYVQLKTSLTPHSAQNARDSLRRVLGTWDAWDDLQWLANHHTVRSTLWDILNQGTPSGHAQYRQYFDLQNLLNSDLLTIQSQILIILNDQERKCLFYESCSADPVPTLNLLQAILDQGNISTTDRPRFARTLTRLAKYNACLPDCLVLSGVKRTGRDPVAGGGFADVWIGEFDSTLVAIKALRIYEDSDQEQALREFSHEAVIWRMLRHPNILPFYGVCRGEEHFDRLCLVSPWMDAGNVIKYLAKNPESDRFALLGDVVNGLAYLHEFQPTIIHGDLKGANIFVTSGPTACLGDFGISRFHDSKGTTLGATTGNTPGTLRWQAPELFDIRSAIRPSQESDIYSFGCVCLEVMTGRPPFMEFRQDGAVLNAIMNKQTPQRPAEDLLKYGFDDDLWALMKKCWNFVPTQRPEIGLLLQYFNRRRESPAHVNRNEKPSHEIRASLDQYGFPHDHVRAVSKPRNQMEEVQRIRRTRNPAPINESSNSAVELTHLETSLKHMQTTDHGFHPIHPHAAVTIECDPSAFQPNLQGEPPYIAFPWWKRHCGAATKLIGDNAPVQCIEPAIDNSKPWYLRPTYGRGEILIDPDGGIRGGTLPAMVELLTSREYRDPTFTKTFFITYKSFTNLDVLFDLLVTRFHTQAPETLDPFELEEWTTVKQTVIRFDVISLFKTIITDSEVLEKDENYILERMKDFCLSPGAAGLRASKHLLDLIQRTQAGRDSNINMTAGQSQTPPLTIQPKVSLSRKLQFLDVDVLEMARQLTILESRCYNKIRMVECLQRARESYNSAEHHDHITDVIQMTNKIAYWVTSAILSGNVPQNRATIVNRFISVADHCRILNNFSSMVAIISGLNSPPIRHLKCTWDHVDSECISKLRSCEMTLDSGGNLAKYRSTLAEVNPPCVPFIGVYLVDLTSIRNSYKDYLQPNVINFGKCQRIAEVVREIKRWQSKTFSLNSIPVVLDFIEESLASFSDATNWNEYFWNMSLEREPEAHGRKDAGRLSQEDRFF